MTYPDLHRKSFLQSSSPWDGDQVAKYIFARNRMNVQACIELYLLQPSTPKYVAMGKGVQVPEKNSLLGSA